MGLGEDHPADFCMCDVRFTVLTAGHTSGPTHCGQSQWAEMFRPLSGHLCGQCREHGRFVSWSAGTSSERWPHKLITSGLSIDPVRKVTL